MRLKFVAPLMPTLVEKPPEGDNWILEVKFDGYRSQIYRRVNDSHFQKLLAHVSARALYCDSERPSLGCLEIKTSANDRRLY
ncbi:hypothetical protein B5V02_20840 [Mesorhizobium kowhaii]|uniref:ATP-dependent DNA ligase family profile domain-containing protein n=1 Tax=Mesorhizobium kowhaii TaxID=1300272 RepID=A0A2W7C0N2_9HYPH|nr:hypothetical protein [Mesorhizobium kowhaii]PZV36650.1 hypothetical protein B5V02_20840 [Mesorhizobium kowhaii]